MATNINIIAPNLSGDEGSLLSVDNAIRAAVRANLLSKENTPKIEKKAESQTTKASGSERSSNKPLQDPGAIRKKKPVILTAGSSASNAEEDAADGGSTEPTFSPIMRAVDTLSGVNDDSTNEEFAGWFGIAFTVATSSPLRLEYVGNWDRENNGIGSSIAFALWGPSGLIWNATISSGDFVYSKDQFRYAKIPAIILEAGGQYGLFRYYYANNFTDRYQYHPTYSAASYSDKLSACGNAEISTTDTSPQPVGIGSGNVIFAMTVNFATSGYFS